LDSATLFGAAAMVIAPYRMRRAGRSRSARAYQLSSADREKVDPDL